MNKNKIFIGLGIIIIIAFIGILGTIIIKHISTKTSSETGGNTQTLIAGEKIETEENDNKEEIDAKPTEDVINITEDTKEQEKVEETKEESSNATTKQITTQNENNSVKVNTQNKETVKQSASTGNTNANTNTQTETQVQQKEQKQEPTQTKTQNENNNQAKESAKPVETTTEEKQNVVDNKPVTCTNNNNHFIEVGNSNRWFSTQKEAIAYYDGLVHELSEKWENEEIDSKTYHKTCPYGYEVWSCGLCGKWTINLYYR